MAAGNDRVYLDMIERALEESVAKLEVRLRESRGLEQRAARVRPGARRPRGSGSGAVGRASLGGVAGGAAELLAPPLRTAAVQGPRLHGVQSLDTALHGRGVGGSGGVGVARASGAGVAGLGGGGAGGGGGGGAGPAVAAEQGLPPSRQRIITVSLRLPTKADRESVRQQLFDARVSPKGMFALENASDLPFVWVGSPDRSVVGSPSNPELFEEVYGSLHNSTRLMEEPTESAPRQASHNVPVTLPNDKELMEAYYTFCNKTLWNILNYDYSSLATDDEMGSSEKHWNAYRVVNQQFAEAVSEIYEEGDLIWVHNFHLMLLPSMLRQRLWYAKIGFFLYSAFPSAEIFRILPYRVEILKGVLGSDLVGFHTYDFSKQFVASCTRLLGLEGTPNRIEVEPRATRHCEFGIYPAGIDVRALRICANSKKVQSRVASLRRCFGGRKVLVGIDRLDDAFAGIPLKLLAFERFLADNPGWRGRVVLVQVALLPRQASKTNEPHRAQINEFVARINSQYGSLAFSPVHFVTEELDPVEIQALMCVGHVLIVSVLRDGMGLRPYEWTVLQHSGYKGCMILSEFAGAAASFSTALHVNPWNVDDVSEKILLGLQMKESERSMRDASAYAFVTTHTASLWGLNFLEDLEQADGGADGSGAMMTPVLDAQAVIDAFFRIKPRPSTAATPSSSSAPGLPFHLPSPQMTALETLSAFQRGRSLSVGANAARDLREESPTPSPSAALHVFSPPLPMNASPSNGPSADSASLHPPHLGMAPPPMPLPSSAACRSSYPAVSLPKSAGVTPRTRTMPPGSMKKVLVLDYDGTLVPSQAITELVKPSAQVLQLLLDLTNLESCYIILLSGRDRATMTQWFGHLNLFLAAEDGSFLRAPGENWLALFRRTADEDYGVRHYQDDRLAPSGMASTLTGPYGMGIQAGTESLKDSSVMDPSLNVRDDPEKTAAASDSAKHPGQAPAIPGTESSIHPLLVSSARHKWSLSSFGSHVDTTQPPEWKAQVMPVMHHFAERTPGVVLEEGDASLTWHYNDADADFGRLQARDLQKHLESFLLQHLSIEVVSEEGSSRYPTRWVKVRPSGVDKSVAVERALEWVRENISAQNSSRGGSHGSVNLSGGPSAFAVAAAKATAAHRAAEHDSPAVDIPMASNPAKPAESLQPGSLGADGGDLRNGVWKGFRRSLENDAQPSNPVNSYSGGERHGVDFVLCVGDDRADEGMFDALGDENKLAAMQLVSVMTRVFTCRVGSGATSASFVLESPQKLIDLLEEIVQRERESMGEDCLGDFGLITEEALEEKLSQEAGGSGSW